MEKEKEEKVQKVSERLERQREAFYKYWVDATVYGTGILKYENDEWSHVPLKHET